MIQKLQKITFLEKLQVSGDMFDFLSNSNDTSQIWQGFGTK